MTPARCPHLMLTLNQQIARNTSFCLEWSSFQSEILVKMLEAAKALAQRIPSRATRILLRGASGAGKTFQTLHHPFLYGAVTESGPLCGVQNSDFYKELIQRKYGLSSLQAHREGVALRTVLEDAVNEFAPDMSLVKDVWLHKVSSIDREFTLAAARGGSLQIIDIDVPFLTCCLRIIERIHKQPFSAIPPFEVLLTTFHEIRQSRRYLIEKIRDQKSNCFAYQLLVGCSPMLVAEKKGEKFWVMPGREDAFAEALDTEALNHSGRAYASHLISQSDITQIGPGLRPYLGQPLAATLDRLAKRADL